MYNLASLFFLTQSYFVILVLNQMYGFPASEILYNEDGSVKGVATQDMGIDKDGNKKDSFEPGIELLGKVTVFAEGCRGHLGKQLIEKFELNKGKDPQQYGIGFKEIWEIEDKNHEEGLVMHTAGWPLDNSTYGLARSHCHLASFDWRREGRRGQGQSRGWKRGQLMVWQEMAEARSSSYEGNSTKGNRGGEGSGAGNGG